MQLIIRKLNYTKLLKKLKYLKLNPTSLNPEVQTRMGVHAAIRTQDGRGIGTEMGRKEETRRRRLNRQAATGRNGLFKIKKGKLPSRCIRFRGVVWVIHFILLTEHKPTFSRLRIPPPSQWIQPQCNHRIFLHHERFFFTLIVEENFKVSASTDNPQAMLKI